MTGRVPPHPGNAAIRAAGLFAGIGGIELGLHRSKLDISTELLCDSWAPSQAVLERRFDVEVEPDVRTLKSLPDSINLLAAGFPCTDLSQAGAMAGITGAQSGLVTSVFELLAERQARGRPVTWLMIENVQNMLALARGEAMRYIVERMDELGLKWAYRVVDSRFTGVPQRRRRVIILASPTEDPRTVLFADDAGAPKDSRYRQDAFGFYWTEGRGGLGWARDAVPTLKGGSTIGIPSPPGIWVPDGEPGQRLVMPSVEDAEALQGFPRGWTSVADEGRRSGPRWKLVGNAVTVGVARWVGDRLAEPGDYSMEEQIWDSTGRWPGAAWGENGKVWSVKVSEYPRVERYKHLASVMDLTKAQPVSYKGARGFWSRLEPTGLGRHPGFREAVVEHVEMTDPTGAALSS